MGGFDRGFVVAAGANYLNSCQGDQCNVGFTLASGRNRLLGCRSSFSYQAGLDIGKSFTSWSQECHSNSIVGMTIQRVLSEKNNFSSARGPAVRIYDEITCYDNTISGCGFSVILDGVQVYGGVRNQITGTSMIGLTGEELAIMPGVSAGFGVSLDMPARKIVYDNGVLLRSSDLIDGFVTERSGSDQAGLGRVTRTTTTTITADASVSAGITIPAYERVIAVVMRVDAEVTNGVKVNLGGVTVMQLSTATVNAKNVRFIDQTSVDPCSASSRTIEFAPVVGSPFSAGGVVTVSVISDQILNTVDV
jgi:hypothetical protein